MNLLYLRFWLDNLVDFTTKSLMVDSDRQTGKRGGQNLREKGDERKKEQKWTYSIRDSDRKVL